MATYKFSVISIKMSTAFFTETEKLILRFIWNCMGPWIAKTILQKNKVVGWRLMLLDFKTYDKAVVIKRVWHRHRLYRPRGWNRQPRTKPSQIWPTTFFF